VFSNRMFYWFEVTLNGFGPLHPYAKRTLFFPFCFFYTPPSYFLFSLPHQVPFSLVFRFFLTRFIQFFPPGRLGLLFPCLFLTTPLSGTFPFLPFGSPPLFTELPRPILAFLGTHLVSAEKPQVCSPFSPFCSTSDLPSG